MHFSQLHSGKEVVMVVLFLVTLCLCLAAVANSSDLLPSQDDTEGRIIGGENAIIQEFPFQVSLQTLGQHF